MRDRDRAVNEWWNNSSYRTFELGLEYKYVVNEGRQKVVE